MRKLTVAEDQLLLRAERRRRAAATMQMRISALRGTGELLDALQAALPQQTTTRGAKFQVALLERQVVVVRGLHALPSVVALLAEGQRQSLTALGLAQQP